MLDPSSRPDIIAARVYAIITEGETWEPGNRPEQEAAADLALGMGFDSVILRHPNGTEETIELVPTDEA
jgi:hypothetical protein